MTRLVFLVAWGWLLRAVAPGVAGDDSAELTMAAFRLDVTHPPGYPLLALAGRLALMLPVGSPGFRLNLLCGAACGAGVAVLMYRLTRSLLRALGSPATVTPLLAAFLLLATPACFHQVTECEKYAPHLLLALGLVHAILHPGASVYRAAFAWGLALAHHPQAVLLAPLLWPWRAVLRRPPELALAAVMVLLPLSVKVVYPAVRAQAALRDPALANWGAPRTLIPLARYLTVAQYHRRFGAAARGFGARLAPQLRTYATELGTGVLLLAWLGSLAIWRTVPALAGPLFAVFPLAWAFAGSFDLPLHLSSANHLVPYGLLWMLAACGAARLPCLLAPAVVVALAVSGWNQAQLRLPPEDQHRRFAVWDYNRALLRLAPPNAVLLAGMDNDLFALRYLTGVLHERTDVIPLEPPFTARAASYPSLVRRTVPDLELAGAPGEDPAALFRAVLHGRTGRCVVASGFLESVLPTALRFVGPLGYLVDRRCTAAPGAARQARIWDRLSWRSVRDPESRSPRLQPVTGVYAATLSIAFHAALRDRPADVAAALFEVMRRRFPGDASTFLAQGTLALLNRDAGTAAAAFDRAIAAAPDMLDGYAQQALLLDAVDDRAGLTRLLARFAAARPALDPLAVREAAHAPWPGPALRGLLARAAMAEAEQLRLAGPVHASRAHVLLTLAARLRPDWAVPPLHP